jgi:hypothetical protein
LSENGAFEVARLAMEEAEKLDLPFAKRLK